MTKKVDFKKTLDSYQAKRAEFRVLEIPETQYLMIDGEGDPNTAPEYVAALEALYPLAYKLKFASKKERGRDYVVPPLEGLWWADDMEVFTGARDKSQWKWTMMVMVPEWLGESDFTAAVERVSGAKVPPRRLADVRYETLTEGLSVQTLHVGPYDAEGPLLQCMHDEFIPAQGLRMTGKHHEVYFGDPRRTAPDKLRTLLRQPVARAA